MVAASSADSTDAQVGPGRGGGRNTPTSLLAQPSLGYSSSPVCCVSTGNPSQPGRL